MKYLKVYAPAGKTFHLRFENQQLLENWHKKQNPYYCMYMGGSYGLRIPRTSIYIKRISEEYTPNKIDSIESCEDYIKQKVKSTEDYVKKHPSESHLLIGNGQFS